MDWYDKLNNYFPEEEMKHPQQLKDLVQEKDVYHKEETGDYLVLYAEFPDFIFIDYLLVTSNVRGKGVGSRLLDRFKAKGKMILLEAEPGDAEDVDTQKRLAFYKKNGFEQADHIEYERKDEHGEPFRMNILYWDPSKLSQRQVLDKMKIACREIHDFRSRKYYGKKIADPDKVLHWKH